MTDRWTPYARLKPILQAEAAECGLASLTMIARHHGHKVNLAGMRQRYPTSLGGMTLEALIATAADLGFAPRAVRLDLDELSQLNLPAILHWDLNHFVVLESIGRGGSTVVILDPAKGRSVMPLAKLTRHFSGVALELMPTAAFEPVVAQPRTRLSDLWSNIANFRGAMLQVLMLSIALQVTALLIPFYIQIVIDDAIAQADANLLLLLLLGFSAIYLLNAVTKSVRDWVLLTLGQSLSFDLGGNVVRHLIRLPLAYFERRHVGDLLSRIGSINPIQSLLTRGLVNILIDGTLVCTTLIVMVLISPWLALIVLACTLAYIVCDLIAYPALRRRNEEEILARASEETYLMETIRAVRAVKLHGHEAQRESGWRNLYADVMTASFRSRVLEIRVSFAENTLFGLAFLLCVYFGASQVLSGSMTIGVLLAFLAYRGSFVTSATSLVEQVQRWRLLGLHLERLSDIVGVQKEQLAPHHRNTLLAGPEIRFDDVRFAYDPTRPPVLEQIAFTVPAGSFVALTGSSGAGKTTLMRIMLGLLQPDAGHIVIDGVTLSNATMASWRARTGAVLQDDCLLTGTLADNIAFFANHLDMRQVETAARCAYVHDDIMKMPMAYDTLVADMGSALSSGQRQRILLARALYRDPDVLILDEGTANLDPATEIAVADMIASLPITRFVIAHRPALVERADYVVTLEAGRLRVISGPPMKQIAAAS